MLAILLEHAGHLAWICWPSCLNMLHVLLKYAGHLAWICCTFCLKMLHVRIFAFSSATLSFHSDDYLSVRLCICLCFSLSACLCIYLSICLSVFLSVCLPVHVSVTLSSSNILYRNSWFLLLSLFSLFLIVVFLSCRFWPIWMTQPNALGIARRSDRQVMNGSTILLRDAWR